MEKSFGKGSSPEGLVGNLLDSSMVTLPVDSELGSGDKVEAEHCMGTSDVSCTMIAGSVMDSVTDRDRLNEAQCRYRNLYGIVHSSHLDHCKLVES